MSPRRGVKDCVTSFIDDLIPILSKTFFNEFYRNFFNSSSHKQYFIHNELFHSDFTKHLNKIRSFLDGGKNVTKIINCRKDTLIFFPEMLVDTWVSVAFTTRSSGRTRQSQR